MNKNVYILFSLFLLLAFNESSAQFAKPVSVGFGGGGTILHGDLQEKPVSYAGHLEVDYLITPYITVGVHGEAGRLKGDDFYGKNTDNKYYTVNGNIKVRAGQFLGNPDNYSYFILSDNSFKSFISNVYIGAGVGFISNDITAHRRYSGVDIVPSFQGVDQSDELIIPLNVGVDIPLGQSLYGPTWAINLNYQHSFSMDDNLDGYKNDFSKYNDHYGYFSLGVKIALFNRR